ncbi:s-adenosylmethionine decarboxylase proenzyme [Nicotiana attenuata]|uniref:S-adenosylmethionine decarboxylase proenzyme n=1 Tax=Nicotiana attenuata TaxID=49451 RepID=A0A1J6KD49_NICAT|nr:s-adenosylmethionine decarboxylase proenzyme [Nicotiana attenuata]
MCMTNLDKKKVSVFCKTTSSSALMMTEVSGIRKILPDSKICDFNFDPCGYSMNAMEGDASNELLEERCFGPEEFSIALHCDSVGKEVDTELGLDLSGYVCGESNYEVLGEGGPVTYFKFSSSGRCGSPRSILHSWSENEDEEMEKI